MFLDTSGGAKSLHTWAVTLNITLPIGIIHVTLLERAQHLVFQVLRQLIEAINQIGVTICDVLPRLELLRSDAAPVLPAPGLVVFDLDQGAVAELAFLDLDAIVFALGVLATGAVVVRDLCGGC